MMWPQTMTLPNYLLLVGWLTLLAIIRRLVRQAADFRKGYGNWRSKKSKGARGETNYLLDKEKLHATDAKHEEVC